MPSIGPSSSLLACLTATMFSISAASSAMSSTGGRLITQREGML